MLTKIIKVVILIILAVVLVRAVMTISGYKDGEIIGDKVAVIDFEGIILKSEDFINSLKDLEDTQNVHGIIIRVNSPGGAVTPSAEIYDYILTIKKPVYIAMGSVAASGGYMISLAGNKIYAMPSTITGSIGVIMNLTNLEELYNKIGIRMVTIKSGQFKDIGNPDRHMTEAEREILTAVVMDMYEQFVSIVSSRRNIPREELLKIADGRILTGHMAKELNLVDALGSWRDAFSEMKSVLNMPDLEVYEVKKKKKWWEEVMEERLPILDNVKNLKLSSGLYFMGETWQ